MYEGKKYKTWNEFAIEYEQFLKHYYHPIFVMKNKTSAKTYNNIVKEKHLPLECGFYRAELSCALGLRPPSESKGIRNKVSKKMNCTARVILTYSRNKYFEIKTCQLDHVDKNGVKVHDLNEELFNSYRRHPYLEKNHLIPRVVQVYSETEKQLTWHITRDKDLTEECVNHTDLAEDHDDERNKKLQTKINYDDDECDDKPNKKLQKKINYDDDESDDEPNKKLQTNINYGDDESDDEPNKKLQTKINYDDDESDADSDDEPKKKLPKMMALSDTGSESVLPCPKQPLRDMEPTIYQGKIYKTWNEFAIEYEQFLEHYYHPIFVMKNKTSAKSYNKLAKAKIPLACGYYRVEFSCALGIRYPSDSRSESKGVRNRIRKKMTCTAKVKIMGKKLEDVFDFFEIKICQLDHVDENGVKVHDLNKELFNSHRKYPYLEKNHLIPRVVQVYSETEKQLTWRTTRNKDLTEQSVNHTDLAEEHDDEPKKKLQTKMNYDDDESDADSDDEPKKKPQKKIAYDDDGLLINEINLFHKKNLPTINIVTDKSGQKHINLIQPPCPEKVNSVRNKILNRKFKNTDLTVQCLRKPYSIDIEAVNEHRLPIIEKDSGAQMKLDGDTRPKDRDIGTTTIVELETESSDDESLIEQLEHDCVELTDPLKVEVVEGLATPMVTEELGTFMFAENTLNPMFAEIPATYMYAEESAIPIPTIAEKPATPMIAKKSKIAVTAANRNIVEKTVKSTKKIVLCRGCLSSQPPLEPLVGDLAKLYREFIDNDIIDSSVGDVFPKFLCKVCSATVLQFAAFREKCLWTQKYFIKNHIAGIKLESSDDASESTLDKTYHPDVLVKPPEELNSPSIVKSKMKHNFCPKKRSKPSKDIRVRGSEEIRLKPPEEIRLKSPEEIRLKSPEEIRVKPPEEIRVKPPEIRVKTEEMHVKSEEIRDKPTQEIRANPPEEMRVTSKEIHVTCEEKHVKPPEELNSPVHVVKSKVQQNSDVNIRGKRVEEIRVRSSEVTPQTS